jgi:Cu(I)/Ag(I) efflux system membrane protein CusA/SilA
MSEDRKQPSFLDRIIRFCLENKLVVALIVTATVGWGVMVAPFDWDLGGMPRNPVPVDAIPDIGENQQIVFTEWEGRSPQDIENQITYPLTVSLLGIPKVKTIRSRSMFGFSSIFIIFEEDAEFYWTRSRVLEKLNSLPSGVLPTGVQPALGPDATALGQVFWYTLEGLDEAGTPTGGWDLEELRGIQDWYVRFALLSAEGISEVASVGGYVREYQVDVDPDALRAHGVTLDDVYRAVTECNLDVGARSIEINKVEYFIRGIGFVKTIEDIEDAVIKVNDGIPLQIRHVARVSRGPAFRQGALDKEGAEAVGGVVVTRYGGNPLKAIQNVKAVIERIAPGLPSKAVIDFTRVTPPEVERFAAKQGFAAYADGALNRDAWVQWLQTAPRVQRPDWIKLSQVKIVPFYDRTGLIYETLGTLSGALYLQILVTIIVILIMMMHLRSSVLISAVMPVAVAMCFIFMKVFGVDANIVALSGIAIAIGTVVDMGILVCENILRHLDEATPDENRLEVIYRAASEEGSAVLTAVCTTVVSFMAVFALEGAEGKLFKPLAYTYIFVLASSLVVSLTIVPAFAHVLIAGKPARATLRNVFLAALFGAGVALAVTVSWWAGTIMAALAVWRFISKWIPARVLSIVHRSGTWIVTGAVAMWLASRWLPLGPEKGFFLNLVFVVLAVGSVLGIFLAYRRLFPRMLRWCLDHKLLFCVIPACIYLMGMLSWLGFERLFGWLPQPVKRFAPVSYVLHAFPGLGKEFMPPLDEGSYLFMPTTMPHAGIREALDVLQKQDMAMLTVPEIAGAVGKLGRAETPLDPAPVEMFETVINYKPQYITDRAGRRLTFKHRADETDLFRTEDGAPLAAPDGLPYVVPGRFERDEAGRLVHDRRGKPFRLWRPALDPGLNPGREAWPGIRKPDDIWDAIVKASELPGTTSAPRLQPIAARIVMLQSGMRAPMGVKVKGPTLEAIEEVGLRIEQYLKEVPSVEASAVVADRIVGKPYLEIKIDRKEAARYGVSIARVQDAIEVAVGGKRLTTTVEGRERYPVRVRYARELRDSVEALQRILIAGDGGAQVPLAQLADIEYVRGPQEIKSEDTFLTGYVLFDKKPDKAEVDVVEECARYLKHKMETGDFILPPNVSFHFAGSYENQIRSEKKLMIVLPMSLFIIFLILYLQFRDIPTAFLVFVDIASSWMAGFIALWLYAQPWFLDFALFDVNLRELFQIHPVNLSVAIWVGFLALFGIATDDGVVLSTYLNDCFSKTAVRSKHDIREITVEGASRRVRACLMTTATTVIAFLPVFTSTGRGADVMRPMAIPVFAGMFMAIITPIFVPVLYCLLKEIKFAFHLSDPVLRIAETREPETSPHARM